LAVEESVIPWTPQSTAMDGVGRVGWSGGDWGAGARSPARDDKKGAQHKIDRAENDHWR
jgi:hypothetical protein